ncbi:MAG: hypothetical protein AAFZ11_00900 [Pseudomonadota bacterium]
MLSLGAIWAGLRLFLGGAAEWLFKALWEAFKWVFSDAMRAIIAVSWALLAWLYFFALPGLAEQRNEALVEADENLEGWIAERKAHAASIDNHRAASAAALAEAKANAARVEAQQRAINERNARDYEARLGALRDRYDSLVRLRDGRAPADQRAGAGGADAAGLPGVAALPGSADEAASDPRLPAAAIEQTCPADRICLTLEEAWIASVQALQLDALITTIEERQAVPETGVSGRE